MLPAPALLLALVLLVAWPATASAAVLAPLDADPATVWAVGDGANGRAPADDVAALIESREPDRFLYLGDVYSDGTAEEFASNYAEPWGSFDAIAAPTPGNHEWPNRDQGYRPYWEEALGRPIPDHYAFRVGRWQLLSLNSEEDHDEGSDQVRWLRQALRGSRRFGDCRIAFWHRPLENAGTSHGDEPDVAPLFEPLAGRARLALYGHEHSMQRLRHRDGITQLIAGAGGADLNPVEDSDPRLRFADDSHFGALRLRLRGRRAGIRFVAEDGEVLDRSQVRCHPG